MRTNGCGWERKTFASSAAKKNFTENKEVKNSGEQIHTGSKYGKENQMEATIKINITYV